MKTVPPPSHVTAESGRTARVEIEVTNTSDEIDGYTAIVDGIDPSWVRLERPLVTVFPEATDRIVINIDIPNTCQAGDYLIDVRVISAIDPYRESSQDFWLTVPPNPDFEVRAHPSVITAGGKAATLLTVVNTGNCDVSVGLTAIEPGREVNCEIAEPRITVPFKSSADTELFLRGRRPWFGQPETRMVEVTAQSDALVSAMAVRFNQKARIPRGVITILTLLLIIALWATIFLLAIDFIRGTADPSKTAAGDLDRGRDSIALELIRGTVNGSVVGGSGSVGIPAVTVTAYRVADVPINPLFPSSTPAKMLETVASGGTGDDGTYRLRTLIPGDYLLHFSATGFEDTWYPGQFGAAEPITIERQEDVDVPDISLIGKLGSVSATIELPPGTDVSALRATIVTANPEVVISGFRGVERSTVETASCTITADDPDNPADPTPTATVTCTGLPTPGEYVLEISGEGFETQQIEVSLVGGDDTVVDTQQLTGEPSSITGVVSDTNGTRLAGATVTVSAGQFRARVFSDNNGQFVVDELPTPADYVVDISLNGYVGQTSALELLPATTSTVDAVLVAGIGSIEGTVTGIVDGGITPVPLGAVDVFVTGDKSSARTATLTEGDRGAFRVEGLTVPGTYTVVFSAPGYLTETRIVQFDTATSQSLGTIRLDTSVGTVTGTVVDPRGTPIVGAEVELTNGVSVRTTITTAPSGRFAFEDVTPGTYSIVVRATDTSGNLAIYSVLREIAAGESVTLDDLPVPLTAFGRISGTVVDTDGEPLANVFVVLTKEGIDRTTSTDSFGVYAIDGVDVPGTYTLDFILENYEFVDSEQVELDPVTIEFSGDGEETYDAEMEPQPGLVIGTVRALTDFARRLEGAIVSFYDDTATLTTAVETDENGQFYILEFAPGTYDVEARWCDDDEFAPTWEMEIEIPAGGYNFDQDNSSEDELIRMVPETFSVDTSIAAQQEADNCPAPIPAATPTTTTSTTVPGP